MSYTRIAQLQIGAKTQPQDVRVDARAADAIASALRTGSTISVAEMQRQVLPAIDDYKGYVGQAEWPLVRALTVATDPSQVVVLDGRRVRMTEPARNVFTAYRAALDAKLLPPKISDAQFRQAVSTSLRDWYRAELARRVADIDAHDPQRAASYTPTQRAQDRARADEPSAFEWGGRHFSIRTDDNIGKAHLGARAKLDFPYRYANGGRGVPLADVAFVELRYDPWYAGQDLSSFFAFDRRTGTLLEHFGTH